MDKGSLASAKRESTFELLFRTARVVNELALERFRSASGQDIRASHTALLPHIDLEGTRLTVLAARLGVTKQAVAQLVDELVAWGALERAPDPSDGRAKLIRFAQGGEVLLEGLSVLTRLEAELAKSVGDARIERMRGDLLALHEAAARAR